MKKLEVLKAELLEDRAVRQAYEEVAIEYQLARAILRQRLARRRLKPTNPPS